MRKTHVLPKGTKLQSRHRQVFDTPIVRDGSTCGKTKTRKLPQPGEVQDFMQVIGAGRYTTPISAARRIGTRT